jgi:hypothetical protein
VTCGEIEERSPLYLTGELEDSELREFEQHLAGCGDCSQSIRLARDLGRELRMAYSSASVETRAVEAAVKTEIRRRPVLVYAGWAAAALVLLALAIGGNNPTPKLVTDAVADHRAEVTEQRPRRWMTADSDVAALLVRFGAPGGRAILPGYRLMRAKICGLDGRRVLHLVYSDGRSEFSVFLTPGADLSGKQWSVQEAAVAGFSNPRVRGLVVGTGLPEICAALAQAAASDL